MRRYAINIIEVMERLRSKPMRLKAKTYEEGFEVGKREGKSISDYDNAKTFSIMAQENQRLMERNAKYREENEALKERVAALLIDRINLLDNLAVARFPDFVEGQQMAQGDKEQADDQQR
jgi:hypothetical protein